ncbi:MAG: diguanylate cyclase response regulator [Gallionellales bacterium 35-53-114]|jgi:diguanylate cyclase (GGDEF)-like protein|nr:MAG: diguanylate cyclase response regulator [Gallionellales bacterium 35-53-114]OYZ62072.1 MAG: diguanylate cyclase response regulator [Gallionellales bacterium 24-53-125]OZB07177.1 MAG: diguanylate cyclase response regulator [Gallionellales bacterium 39-52-133]HQS58451.1 diguanylate cyclase [Gallionellaceae bacterium]HQS74792.1 diguanylate cyclase [Gallionellaceae bacterium]
MISTADILNANILIVDDQQANVLLLQQMLQEEGYTNISSTTDPFAVCAMHRKGQYDLILLDLQMPGKDGFQVMEELGKIEAQGYLPVLVITAQPNHKLRALAAGARDFISKPFDMLEAKTRIRNMLEVRLLYRQLEHYNQVLESMALHDTLTGLPNRRLLLDRLSLSIAHARRNKSSAALLYLNLNGLDQISETPGHDTGDTLLGMVAARLQAAVRQEDTVARINGDEFMISLWELSHANGLNELVSRILHSVSQPYRINGSDALLTPSVGVSLYPAHGEEAETLMQCAKNALHEAMRNGKNDSRIASRSGLLATMTG